MKAIILNSGVGRRMGNLTKDKPKCLINISENETILARQLDILRKNNIKDIIITTGPFEEKIKKHVEERFPDINVTYINNRLYNGTNYIYSMGLIDDQLINEDILLLHGDLVFEEDVVKKILRTKYDNAVLINKASELPEKDFKGRVIDNEIKHISIDIFHEDCYFLIPLYKFKKNSFKKWLDEISIYINKDEINVYAENALNELLESETISLKSVYFEKQLCLEVDNLEDLDKAKSLIHMRKN